jgi:hypothetical protein
LYSGLVNLHGGRALTNFSVLFGGSAEGTTPAADQYGPPEGLIEYENLMAWDTTFRRRDGMPRAEGEVIAPARGTVLIRPLNCSEITECRDGSKRPSSCHARQARMARCKSKVSR